MLETSATQLVSGLRGLIHRHRTGILLLPRTWLGREREVAARLEIGYEDHRQRVLSRLAPGQRYFGLGRTGIASDLDDLASGAHPNGGCVLVANLDLLLSSLRTEDRNQFWAFMRRVHKPPWGLLLVLPAETRRLMTEDERSLWTSARRLAIWEGGERSYDNSP